MDKLIKHIRDSAALSQEQFAQVVGTSATTVNRWENGKATPNNMAQKSIHKFCSENNIDIAAFVVDGFRRSTDDELILYHGSRRGIVGKIAPISRDKCDFGSGFYTGTDPLQPLTLVCDEDKPIFYTLRLDTSKIKVLHVKMGLEWAMLIAYYRGYMESVKGTPIYEKYAHLADGYDVVVGYIANDRMYQTLTDFFNQGITDKVMIESLSALGLGTQYVAVTQKGCDAFEILDEHPLRPLELLSIKEKSVINRKAGVALADEMRRKYRREGRFFDEILREG